MQVLRQNANIPMSAVGITTEIESQKLYVKKDGTFAKRKQIVARITSAKYSHLFERVSPGFYRLR